MSEAQTVKTALHEASHASLHNKEAMNADSDKKSRNQKECEAESVAYRITDLRSFIGIEESDMTEEQIKEEVEEDKQDSITNTYKRGDLLKMHTYNDAIRKAFSDVHIYQDTSIDEDLDILKKKFFLWKKKASDSSSKA